MQEINCVLGVVANEQISLLTVYIKTAKWLDLEKRADAKIMYG